MTARLIILMTTFLFLAACNNYGSNLENLGQLASYSDEEIPDDFNAPEDEEDSSDDGGGFAIEDPDGSTLPPVVVPLKNTFSMSSTLYSLAHGKANRWNGCEGSKSSQGGYNSDSRCGTAFFHPSFADNLNEAFFTCAREAAVEAGLPQPQRIFIRHLGSYNDRNARGSSRLSNHAYARALDIVNFNLYDHQGGHFKVSTYLRDYKGAQAVFYDTFRDCWADSIPSSCRAGNTEYLGSIGHRSSKLGGNSLHNDHLHLSYPLCAG